MKIEKCAIQMQQKIEGLKRECNISYQLQWQGPRKKELTARILANDCLQKVKLRFDKTQKSTYKFAF